MQRIILVRHAHAEWIPGNEARPLSPQGLEDAQTLVPLLVPEAPHAIYSSPFARARQTIEPTAEALGLEVEEVAGLRERTLAEGAVEDFEAAMAASWEDFDLVFPGGESSSDSRELIYQTVIDLAARHRDDVIMLAGHGNTFGLLMNRFDRSFGYEFWQSLTWPDVLALTLESGGLSRVERLWSPA
ncbi:MAG: histidine phosphatase family protein [Planctomycetota bacterium]|jgi:2,3-bisphosphoglycerate-dependent phosphoglycerate mutase